MGSLPGRINSWKVCLPAVYKLVRAAKVQRTVLKNAYTYIYVKLIILSNDNRKIHNYKFIIKFKPYVKKLTKVTGNQLG